MYSSYFLHIANLQGIGLADVSGRLIKVLDLDHRPVDPVYFDFSSIVSAVAIDNCDTDKSLSNKVSLCLPQTLAPKGTSFRILSVSTVDIQVLSDFGAKLGSFTDVSFDKPGVTELWGYLADTRTTISLLVVTSPFKDV